MSSTDPTPPPPVATPPAPTRRVLTFGGGGLASTTARRADAPPVAPVAAASPGAGVAAAGSSTVEVGSSGGGGVRGWSLDRCTAATLAGPSPAGVAATHAAWVAGHASGYAFTAGLAPEALGVLLCPAHGMVSVWRYGAVPPRLASRVRPWVLVQGEGCNVVRAWDGAPPALDTGVRTSGLGIDLPVTTWVPLGHPWLDSWIDTIAAAYGAPPLLVGMLCIGALSAALCSKLRTDMYVNTPGGGRGIRWSEPTAGLYVMGVAPSGVRKTPMLEHFLGPWRLAQEQRTRSHRSLEAAHKIRIKRAERLVEKCFREGDKAKQREADNPGYIDPALLEAQTAASEPPPRKPSLIVGNASGPALAVEMSWEPSVLMASSEASEIFKALQRDDSADIEPLLMGYSGQSPGATLRITRDQPIGTAYRATVLAMTQQDWLYGVGETLSARGQGLFARFLWVGAGAADDSHGVIPAEMANAWQARIQGLMSRMGPIRDAWGVETGSPTPVQATPAQTERLLALEARMKARAVAGGDLFGIDTWTRKAHGQAARIASVLSSCDAVGRTVQGPIAMQDRYLDWALNLVERQLVPHAQYAAKIMAWPKGTDDAVHLYAILDGKLAAGRHTFAATEIDSWVPEWPTEQTDTALTTLANRGFATIVGKARAERLVSFRR